MAEEVKQEVSREVNKEAVEFASGMVDMLRRPQAMTVSYTKLDTYRTCPRKYKYLYIEKEETVSSEKMLIGQAVHSTLETWIAEQGEDLGDLMDIFTASCVAWRSQGFISDEEEQLARQMLIDYYGTLEKVDRKRIVAIEKPFNYYTDNVCINGVLDRVEWEDEDILSIMDYKTGRSSISQASAKKNLQMAIYTMAAKQIWPEAKHYITKLIYPRLNKTVMHEFTLEELEEHRNNIVELATNIRLDTNFKPSGTPPICANCSFKHTCGWGKKMDKIWQGILKKRSAQNA